MNRAELTSELHARSVLPVESEAIIHHYAFAGDRESGERYLRLLLSNQGITPKDNPSKFEVIELDDKRLRWEQHTEFFTITLYDDNEKSQSLISLFTEIAHEERLLLLVHMELVIQEADPSISMSPHELNTQFNEASLCGILISGGGGAYFSDFRLSGSDLISHHVILNYGMTRHQLGRQVTRVIEIETYRVLAMVGYQHTQAVMSRLAELEEGTHALIAMVAAMDRRAGRELLDEVTSLSSQTENLIAELSFRLNITQAYAQILHERIESLRGERVGQLRDLKGFMHRRFTPLMRAVQSFEARLERLLKRLDRASNLIRTRVDVQLEEQNSELLKSMDRRAKLQLRLQNTVEGLSIIALSYYAVGLMNYALTPLGKVLNFDAKVVSSSLAIPIVLLMIWNLRRIHSIHHMRS